jgi:hypothetical protein
MLIQRHRSRHSRAGSFEPTRRGSPPVSPARDSLVRPAPPRPARWFKRKSIAIANGEEVGVLVPVNPADASTTETADDRAERVHEVILEQVEAASSAWNRDQSRLPLSNQPPVLRRAAGVVRGLDETPAKSLIFLPRDVCGACGGWGSNALKSLARGFAGVSGACFPPYPPSAHAREALRLRRPWRGSAPRAARASVGGL